MTQRSTALDALRGLAVAGMVLVNNPGSWQHLYPPLAHAPWHGCTPTDLVFPFFLFAVGAAMAFARPSHHTPAREFWPPVLRRAAI
jgi:predicted acyltransferase